MQQVRLLLKEKYSLVHVPAERKVREWRDLVKQLISEGQMSEQAGIMAAKKVFPYEYREYRIFDGVSVNEILSHFH